MTTITTQDRTKAALQDIDAQINEINASIVKCRSAILSIEKQEGEATQKLAELTERVESLPGSICGARALLITYIGTKYEQAQIDRIESLEHDLETTQQSLSVLQKTEEDEGPKRTQQKAELEQQFRDLESRIADLKIQQSAIQKVAQQSDITEGDAKLQEIENEIAIISSTIDTARNSLEKALQYEQHLRISASNILAKWPHLEEKRKAIAEGGESALEHLYMLAWEQLHLMRDIGTSRDLINALTYTDYQIETLTTTSQYFQFADYGIISNKAPWYNEKRQLIGQAINNLRAARGAGRFNY